MYHVVKHLDSNSKMTIVPVTALSSFGRMVEAGVLFIGETLSGDPGSVFFPIVLDQDNFTVDLMVSRYIRASIHYCEKLVESSEFELEDINTFCNFLMVLLKDKASTVFYKNCEVPLPERDRLKQHPWVSSSDGYILRNRKPYKFDTLEMGYVPCSKKEYNEYLISHGAKPEFPVEACE